MVPMRSFATPRRLAPNSHTRRRICKAPLPQRGFVFSSPPERRIPGSANGISRPIQTVAKPNKAPTTGSQFCDGGRVKGSVSTLACIASAMLARAPDSHSRQGQAQFTVVVISAGTRPLGRIWVARFSDSFLADRKRGSQAATWEP